MELQRNDPAGAAAAFRELARSPNPGIRAGALLRLARNLRKIGKPETALAAYSELAGLRTATIRGIPAELLARQARCSLLDEMARVSEMSREVRALYSDLQDGRWMLLRADYKFHSDEALRRLKSDHELEAGQARERERLALAEGVEWLWDVWQRQRRGEGEPSGRRGLWLAGRFVSLIWSSQPDRMAALVMGPRFVESQASSKSSRWFCVTACG